MKKPKIVVISFDGGGIRGIVPATILQYLEKQIVKLAVLENSLDEFYTVKNQKIIDYIDFLGGTSTGALVSSMLTVQENNIPKYTSSDILKFYNEIGPTLFKRTLWQKIKTMWGLLRPKYYSELLERELQQVYGEHTIDNSYKPIMLTSYDLASNNVIFFTSHDKNRKFTTYKLKNILKGAISAPTYFKPEKLNDYILSDAGVAVNNPSLCTLIEVAKYYKDTFNKIIKFNDIMFISIGTGETIKKHLEYENIKKWGILKWSFPILGILMNASQVVVNYQMEKTFNVTNIKDQYFRLNPKMNLSNHAFDDASDSNVKNINLDVNNYIEENKELLNYIAKLLYENKKQKS